MSVRDLSVWSYSRVVVEALSTEVGFSCRIKRTSTVVVCTTETEKRTSVRMRRVQRGRRSGQESGIKGWQEWYEQFPFVGTDRCDAQVRGVGDLTDGFSRADETQHFVSPIRQ